VVLLAPWDVYRIPLAFRLVRRKGSQGYQSEQVLFRQMLQELGLPRWCSKVIVVADAAYASRANLRAIQARHWWFVSAFPRTWKFTDGHSLRDLVAHLPRVYYRKVRLPLVGSRARYRVFWTFAKPTTLREVGDVTVVLSERRRNDGPQTDQSAGDQSAASDRAWDRGMLPQTLAAGTVLQGMEGGSGRGATPGDQGCRTGGTLGGGDADGLSGLAAGTG